MTFVRRLPLTVLRVRSKVWCVGVAVIVVALVARPALASTITVDFDTVATGSTIATTPLVTSLGTITASASGGDIAVDNIPDNLWPAAFNNVLWHAQGSSDSDYAQLAFDFDVSSLTFHFGGIGGGVFTAQALNGAFGIVDSFFDADTRADIPGGPITLTGSGIRYLRFGDFPSDGGFASSAIDNVRITDVAAIPEPTSLLLLGSGLSGLGASWRRKHKTS